jgi:maleylpyruvate isomerase
MTGYAFVHGDIPLDRLDDDAVYDEAIALLAEVTDLVLDDVRAMDDGDVAQPSLLPGWSRGHVLAHLARNADATGNLLAWARSGDRTPMYSSWEERDAAIERDAGRSASDHEADVEASGERLLADLAALPVGRRHAEVVSGSGTPMPAHDVLWWRIREVSYHWVDLDRGHGFADLPPAVLARGLAEAVPRLTAKGAPGVGLQASDEPWSGRLGNGGPVVRGPRAALLGWLTGRSDGRDLESDGPLPPLPSWG